MSTCDTECGSSKFYVGDVGTELLVDVCVDISDASAVRICIMKPGATTEVTWNAAVYQSRYLRHVCQAGDLSVAGAYLVQAWVQTPSGSWRGDVGTFRVYGAFE